MIDEKSLSQAKEVILVNTSRADIIDRLVLEKALNSQKVIFMEQTFFGESHPISKTLGLSISQAKRCSYYPHVGWYSRESERDLRRKAAEEVARLLREVNLLICLIEIITFSLGLPG